MLMKEQSIITNVDEQRLRQTIASIEKSLPIIGDPFHSYLRALGSQLARSAVVSQPNVEPDIVTMNSKISVHELDTGKRRTVTLVYPHDTGSDGERISVLTALGKSLLGARVGDTIEWTARRGLRRMWIERIVFQPEAAGEFDL